ncbi:MAG TPA: hypothetical protein VIM65_22295 [Cyclobacteriaceae bacterium]
MRQKDKDWVSLLIGAETERLSARVADLEKRSAEMKQYLIAEQRLKDEEYFRKEYKDDPHNIPRRKSWAQALNDVKLVDAKSNNDAIEPYKKWYRYAIEGSGFEGWLNEYLELRSAANYGGLFNHMNKMPKIPEINLDPIEIDSNEDLLKQVGFEPYRGSKENAEEFWQQHKRYLTSEEKQKLKDLTEEHSCRMKQLEYPKLDPIRESELKELLSDAGKQEHRKTALITAINMAMSEDLHIPKEWIEELNELLNK